MQAKRKYSQYNKQTKCRVCLTQTFSQQFALNQPLKPTQDKPLIYEALKLVSAENVDLKHNYYPNIVCGMCLGYLKISYDFILQYRTSTKLLEKEFGKAKKNLSEVSNIQTEFEESEINEDLEEEKSEKAPVELVVGSQKYNIKDLLIVEKDQENRNSYDGFLKNLGKTITATLVEKDYRKSKLSVEPPTLIIEKIMPNQKKRAPKENISNTIIIDEEDSAANNSSENDENPSNLECSICNMKFRYEGNLLKHYNRHKNNKIINKNIAKAARLRRKPKDPCEICGETFPSISALKYHKTKHKGKRFGCEKCGKKFYTMSDQRVHLRTHDKNYVGIVCPICGRNFRYHTGFYYHVKLHKNIRSFQCSFCPRTFFSNTSLKRHELTHTGDRPFSCKYCDKKFRSTGEMRKHEYIHTGERPYRCNFCEKGFTLKYSLDLHLTTHAGDFTCPHCPRNFPNMDILKFHLKVKHKNEDNETVEEEIIDQDLVTEEEQEECLTAARQVENIIM